VYDATTALLTLAWANTPGQATLPGGVEVAETVSMTFNEAKIADILFEYLSLHGLSADCSEETISFDVDDAGDVVAVYNAVKEGAPKRLGRPPKQREKVA
jgi:hypothetical protein